MCVNSRSGSAENTTIVTKDGSKRNGNLLYTICPIQLALDQFYELQQAQWSTAVKRQRDAKAFLALCDDKEHSA